MGHQNADAQKDECPCKSEYIRRPPSLSHVEQRERLHSQNKFPSAKRVHGGLMSLSRSGSQATCGTTVASTRAAIAGQLNKSLVDLPDRLNGSASDVLLAL
jgi:hypothetical protein